MSILLLYLLTAYIKFAHEVKPPLKVYKILVCGKLKETALKTVSQEEKVNCMKRCKTLSVTFNLQLGTVKLQQFFFDSTTLCKICFISIK